MALKTLVKVGSVTNLSDARYCAGMGVDFLGFRFVTGQPGAIQIKSFQEIRGWVSGPQIVAEIYGVPDAEHLHRIMEDTQPDYLELSPEDYERIGSAISLPYILNVTNTSSLPAFASPPAYLLSDVSEASHVSKWIPEHEVLLQVSTTDELHGAIGHTGISGVALVGGAEIRPGLKSYEELADILEALEEE